MADSSAASVNGMPERRKRRGTWPWFVVNVLLFPAPAHFTLLRVREYSFGKALRHLGVTLLLGIVLGLVQVFLSRSGPAVMEE